MMIFSVPHSGTRTLQAVFRDELASRAYKKGGRSFGFWHFGLHDDEIRSFDGEVHIPLRDPFDICRSWANRQIQQPVGEELRRLDLMIDYAESHDVVLHKIEDIKLKLGEGPRVQLRDEIERRIAPLGEWIKRRIDFYAPYYDFWWVNA